MTAGTYKYAVSFVDTNGNESEIVPYFTYTLTGTNTKLIFYFYAYPVVNVDSHGIYSFLPGIKSVRLYRTKVGGSTYYFHSDIAVVCYRET